MKIIILIVILFISNISFSQKKIAITFDDLPSPHMELNDCIYTTDHLLKILRDNNIKLTGFVNAGKTEIDTNVIYRVEQLRKWLSDGHNLENHTYAHSDIGRAGLIEYQKDVVKGEPLVIKLMEEAGKKMKYFRHPYLYTGKTVEQKDSLDKFLKDRGYVVAPVTLDNSDWLFAACYFNAVKSNNKKLADSIAASYLEYMNMMAEFFENLSQEFLGRQVNHILLVHANMLNADHFDKVINMFRNRGYEFVSLDEAMTDPAYSMPDGQMKWGRSWIHRWMIAQGLKTKPDPDEPQWILDFYKEGQK